jgi:hypothetical protein
MCKIQTMTQLVVHAVTAPSSLQIRIPSSFLFHTSTQGPGTSFSHVWTFYSAHHSNISSPSPPLPLTTHVEERTNVLVRETKRALQHELNRHLNWTKKLKWVKNVSLNLRTNFDYCKSILQPETNFKTPSRRQDIRTEITSQELAGAAEQT